MKFIFLFSFFTVALSEFQALLSGESKSLIAKWDSVSRTKGGIIDSLEFLADGKVVSTLGVMLDFDYKLDGDELSMSMKEASTGKTSEQTVKIRIEGDTLIQKNPKSGGEIRMTRVKKGIPGDPPIVGEWSYIDSAKTKALAFHKFTKDGKMFFRLPMKSESGQYSVTDNLLNIDWKNRDSTSYKFKIERDILSLLSADGSERRYRQAK